MRLALTAVIAVGVLLQSRSLTILFHHDDLEILESLTSTSDPWRSVLGRHVDHPARRAERSLPDPPSRLRPDRNTVARSPSAARRQRRSSRRPPPASRLLERGTALRRGHVHGQYRIPRMRLPAGQCPEWLSFRALAGSISERCVHVEPTTSSQVDLLQVISTPRLVDHLDVDAPFTSGIAANDQQDGSPALVAR